MTSVMKHELQWNVPRPPFFHYICYLNLLKKHVLHIASYIFYQQKNNDKKIIPKMQTALCGSNPKAIKALATISTSLK